MSALFLKGAFRVYKPNYHTLTKSEDGTRNLQGEG